MSLKGTGLAVLAVVAASLTAGVAHADDSVGAVVQAVEARYAKVRSIQADFTQVKTDSFGTMTQEGDVVVDRPSKMRWRFTSGDQSVFATDGQTMTLYNKAANYYQQMADNTASNPTAQGFLTSLDQLDEVFAVTLVDGTGLGGAGPTMNLVPHKPGAFTSVTLDLSADLLLERVVMTDAYGNVTDITFRGVVFDKPVDSAIFNFPKPTAATTAEVDR